MVTRTEGRKLNGGESLTCLEADDNPQSRTLSSLLLVLEGRSKQDNDMSAFQYMLVLDLDFGGTN